MFDLEKIYKPKDIEETIYKYWEYNNFFKLSIDKKKENYCIVIPPPNITGSLHLGHALQQTIMDILIRYNRMQGKNTLWQVGMDHAGIATQIIVERKIFDEEKKTINDFSRNDFLKKIQEWKIYASNIIKFQMKRLGNSIDWTRERFTMDDKSSDSVKEAFVTLYKNNLIYRNKSLVNWDITLNTAVSDLEINYCKVKGNVWYIRYPLANNVLTKNGLNYIVIATTRPETIFGDSCILVNPDDLKTNYLIGKYVFVPLIWRIIPIIGDKYANPKKGTGCVKISPGHDFNDYEIGKKYNLPIISIFTFQGKLREIAKVFNQDGKINESINIKIPNCLHKLDRFQACKSVIRELNRVNLIEKIESNIVTIPYGDRSGSVIEPMITDQWYIKVSSLAKEAINVVKSGKIKFIPNKYEKSYFNWLTNIKDWCISRQILWGHRIPAWYDKYGKIYVGKNEDEIRKTYGIKDNTSLSQDKDVLDTWFSSGIWTFSSLGWPKNKKMLNIFHPTNIIISGFDIIFFWIARMIMLTTHIIKDKNGKPQIPFKKIYITGLIRDERGKKMSKSNGNIIDPIDIINGIKLEELIKKRTNNMMQPMLYKKIVRDTIKYFPNGIKSYGADTLRLSLISLSYNNQYINWDMSRLKGYSNLCNKIWNASKFVLINVKNFNFDFSIKEKIISSFDYWIMTKFNISVKDCTEAIKNYRFDLAVNILYEFIWNQFCDWYLELSKFTFLKRNLLELRGTCYTLIKVLESFLRLAHPFIPFITEYIWQKIKNINNINIKNNTITLQSFPKYKSSSNNSKNFNKIELLKKIITNIRYIKSKINISSNEGLDLFIKNMETKNFNFILSNIDIINHFTKINYIKIFSKKIENKLYCIKKVDELEFFISAK